MGGVYETRAKHESPIKSAQSIRLSVCLFTVFLDNDSLVFTDFLYEFNIFIELKTDGAIG